MARVNRARKLEAKSQVFTLVISALEPLATDLGDSHQLNFDFRGWWIDASSERLNWP